MGELWEKVLKQPKTSRAITAGRPGCAPQGAQQKPDPEEYTDTPGFRDPFQGLGMGMVCVQFVVVIPFASGLPEHVSLVNGAPVSELPQADAQPGMFTNHFHGACPEPQAGTAADIGF